MTPDEATLDLLASMDANDAEKFGNDARQIGEALDDAEQQLTAVLEQDSAYSLSLRFAAFYTLLTRYRKLDDLGRYRELVDSYEAEFSRTSFFSTIRVIYFKSLGETRENLETALTYAVRAREAFPVASGVLHQYAELVASLEERAPSANRQRVEDALEATNIAIATAAPKVNGKYFETRARLYALLGLFDEARRNLSRSVEAEDSGARDYALRLGQRHITGLKIELAEQMNSIRKRETESLAKLDGFRAEITQILGLLVAALAFVFTSVQISSQSSGREGALLISTAGTVLVSVFAAFGIVFGGSSSVRSWIVLVAGSVLTACIIWLAF